MVDVYLNVAPDTAMQKGGKNQKIRMNEETKGWERW